MTVRQIPWTEQPQDAVEVDWGDTGPIAVVVPTGGVPFTQARYLAEPFAVATGTNIDVAPGLLGAGVGSAAQNTNVYRLHSVANATGTVWERPSSAVTVLAYIVRTGNASGNAPLFGNISPTTSPFTAWGLLDRNGVGTASFECSAGGVNRPVNASVPITNGRPAVLVGRYDGAAATIWQDGTQVGSTACSGALTYPSDALARGPALGNFWNFTASSRAFVGRIFVAALWDRALSDAEIARISANPWQLFAPRTQRIWSIGSSAFTFNPVWARNRNSIISGVAR